MTEAKAVSPLKPPSSTGTDRRDCHEVYPLSGKGGNGTETDRGRGKPKSSRVAAWAAAAAAVPVVKPSLSMEKAVLPSPFVNGLISFPNAVFCMEIRIRRLRQTRCSRSKYFVLEHVNFEIIHGLSEIALEHVVLEIVV
jgi:hypothetical protein